MNDLFLKLLAKIDHCNGYQKNVLFTARDGVEYRGKTHPQKGILLAESPTGDLRHFVVSNALIYEDERVCNPVHIKRQNSYNFLDITFIHLVDPLGGLIGEEFRNQQGGLLARIYYPKRILQTPRKYLPYI